jgi:hypothetical protein
VRLLIERLRDGRADGCDLLENESALLREIGE